MSLKEGIYLKKRFLSVVCFVIAAICLAGCNKAENGEQKPVIEKNDPVGPYNVCEGYDFYFDVTDSYIAVYKAEDTEEVFQCFNHDGVEDAAYSLEALRFEDVNFDGCPDLLVPWKRVDGLLHYYAFLWNTQYNEFTTAPSLAAVGTLTVCDGYIEGERLSESGEIYKVKYYWCDDGALEEESAADDDAAAALEFAKALTGEEEVSVTYDGDALIDKTLCRKYSVISGGEQISAVALNYDYSRLFAADDNMVYFEMKKSDDGFKKEASFSTDTYGGEPYGYFCEEYALLNEREKELYNEIYLKVMNVESFSYDSEDAVKAVTALCKDHPFVDCFFEPCIEGTKLSSSYFYSWAPYVAKEDADADVIKSAVAEFEEYIDSIVSAMPAGLSGTDRYIYLAQKLQTVYLNETEHGAEDNFGLLVKGDSENERFAKTYCMICEKANLYCTVSGSKNIIKIIDEKTEVDVRNACRAIPGSEEWQKTFFMN